MGGWVVGWVGWAGAPGAAGKVSAWYCTVVGVGAERQSRGITSPRWGEGGSDGLKGRVEVGGWVGGWVGASFAVVGRRG